MYEELHGVSEGVTRDLQDFSESIQDIQTKLDANEENTKVKLSNHEASVKSQLADMGKSVKEVKDSVAEKAQKKEHEALKAVVLEQQKFLTKIDSEKRSANLIITGVPEDTPLANHSGIAESNDDKVAKILEEIGCPDIQFQNTERLGKQEETNLKRPIKITLKDASNRSVVLSHAKNLKESSEPFKKIYIKKDLNPQVRKELSRLRGVTKREKEKPENTGKDVRFDAKLRKVFVNDVEVDSFKLPHF